MPQSLKDSVDDVRAALSILESRTSYAEALGQSLSGLRLQLDKEQTVIDPSARLKGVMLRAWTQSGWREAAATGIDREPLRRAAEELALHLMGDTPTSGPPGDSAVGVSDAATPESRPIADFTLDERLGMARQWFDWGVSVPGIQNAFCTIQTGLEERLFLSTAGCERYQRVSRVNGSFLALAIENGRAESDYDLVGGTGGREFLDALDEAKVRQTAQQSVALLKARESPTGTQNVILDPGGAGTFAHESFGHGTEADQFLRERSYLKPLLGQTLGPESLTLVDDGSLRGGFGSIFFDDEGFPSHRTVIVDRGRFLEVLHDRETAAAMGRRPTGNARRADFLSRCFVRMTNTFVAPGDMTLEELLREAGDGVLLENCTSGIEDPLGGQMGIKFKKGHRIEHGEITDVLSSMALSGRVLDFLRDIRGVGRATGPISFPGLCGKGHTDTLPSGVAGPYLLSRAVVGRA